MSSAMLKGSVWAAMNYTPPRGRCNHKTSLMSPACPCLRFMLHPIKVSPHYLDSRELRLITITGSIKFRV